MTQSDEPDDALDVEMQCDMLFILSVVCETDMHRKVGLFIFMVDTALRIDEKLSSINFNNQIPDF